MKMSFNSSRLPDSWCSFLSFPNASKSQRSISVNYHVILTTCVSTSLLAPMAVAENALIMAAIWRNPSLRTPSYVLLAGLAFTDFCTGLLTQPFFVAFQLEKMFVSLFIHQIAGFYFSSLTVMAMTIIAVERWLHMSRRSFLTVRRVVIIYITSAVLLIVFVPWLVYSIIYNTEYIRVLVFILFSGAALCFVLTIFAYFKVFQIIRQHQSQVQTNQNAIDIQPRPQAYPRVFVGGATRIGLGTRLIDIQKYKKSVFTILYILAIFLLSYIPFVCCLLVISIMDPHYRTESSSTAISACTAIVFSSSFVNPLLYYRRIKENRDSVRSIVRNVCCKGNEEES